MIISCSLEGMHQVKVWQYSANIQTCHLSLTPDVCIAVFSLSFVYWHQPHHQVSFKSPLSYWLPVLLDAAFVPILVLKPYLGCGGWLSCLVAHSDLQILVIFYNVQLLIQGNESETNQQSNKQRQQSRQTETNRDRYYRDLLTENWQCDMGWMERTSIQQY